ncbi:hypothetical protein [Nonomuraea jabiensis]|uniref:Uncharacterized protein n=1 Tax=Nonomuraea jabiensis TaxID=882448 RepID=A0A7W9FYL0_9ACTN|nr:hypothetical protein [Nonomuraea jabiensis]MBB5773972.1 hypothetical protein [Nonomuraea jabiensis]
MLDALPVTDVGKPYKLALRATRLAEELAPFDGVTVDAVIEDGTVLATVTLPSEVDEAKVTAALSRYTVTPAPPFWSPPSPRRRGSPLSLAIPLPQGKRIPPEHAHHTVRLGLPLNVLGVWRFEPARTGPRNAGHVPKPYRRAFGEQPRSKIEKPQLRILNWGFRAVRRQGLELRTR